MTPIESVPEVWDDERDSRFFRITARLLDPEWVEWASALLASYDLDPSDDVPVRRSAAAPVPVAVRVLRTS